MATTMRRTQIYLPAELTKALDALAHRRGTSRAEVIREAAARLVEGEAPGREHTVLELIGLGQGDGSRVAENHHQYLIEDGTGRWLR